ncbi:MAG: VOC family protein [Pirellulaceae bacterium]|nr:VOC family protein [Pirellulaceae bacterium]
MEMVRNALNWFEIPVDDFERARKFYSQIFDFEMPTQQMGPNLMGFFLFDMQAEGVGGAIIKGEGLTPSATGTLVYLNGGADLTVVLDRVVAAGGTVVLPKMQVTPEIGYIAVFSDTEGNHVALHSRS